MVKQLHQIPGFRYVKHGYQFVYYYIGGLIRRFDEDHLVLLAGGLAFSLIVCVIPLVLVIFSVLGLALTQSEISGAISAYIDRVIPYASDAIRMKVLIYNRVREFAFHKNVSGLIGLGGLLIASTGLFSSMRMILKRIYRIRKTTPLFKGKLRDLIMILIVLTFFLLSVAVAPLMDVAMKYAEKLGVFQILNLELFEAVAVEIITFVVIFLAYGIIYTMVPGSRIPFRVALLSAFTATVLWEVARQLFGLYLMHTISFNQIYGAYAFIVTVAFWIYYSSLVFIVGAQIGQLYRERKSATPET